MTVELSHFAVWLRAKPNRGRYAFCDRKALVKLFIAENGLNHDTKLPPEAYVISAATPRTYLAAKQRMIKVLTEGIET